MITIKEENGKKAIYITITVEQYADICLKSGKFEALEEHGVDNWVGYGDAMDTFYESGKEAIATFYEKGDE